MLNQPGPARLSPDLWRALHEIKTVRTYPKGTQVFRHGSAVKGVHVIEAGTVRLLLPTGPKGRQLLEVVGPGSVLGLVESMSGDNYRVTAEADAHATVAFIARDALREFLNEHSEFCMQIVRLLSEDLHALYHKFRSISAHPGRPRHRSLDEQLN